MIALEGEALESLLSRHDWTGWVGDTLPPPKPPRPQRPDFRTQLYQQWPYCHWCSCRMTIGAESFKAPGKPSGTMATWDHLKSRLMGRRLHERTVKVLACRTCNHNRARMEWRLIYKRRIPLQWARSFMCGMDGDGI